MNKIISIILSYFVFDQQLNLVERALPTPCAPLRHCTLPSPQPFPRWPRRRVREGYALGLKLGSCKSALHLPALGWACRCAALTSTATRSGRLSKRTEPRPNRRSYSSTVTLRLTDEGRAVPLVAVPSASDRCLSTAASVVTMCDSALIGQLTRLSTARAVSRRRAIAVHPQCRAAVARTHATGGRDSACERLPYALWAVLLGSSGVGERSHVTRSTFKAGHAAMRSCSRGAVCFTSDAPSEPLRKPRCRPAVATSNPHSPASRRT